MANRANASFWLRDGSERSLLGQFEKFLATVPFSTAYPGLTQLTVRAVSPAEAPVVEHDLRSLPAGPTEIKELVSEHWHADSACETRAHWDLWSFEPSSGRWQLQPQQLDIFCYGEEYDEGAWRETGHLQVDFGFEHFFTGHAGILASHEPRTISTSDPAEQEFLERMTRPENLRTYHEKTRENIRKLFHWVAQAEAAVTPERFGLWSEGEENLEARLEDILAVR
jgi:hypothetical protein